MAESEGQEKTESPTGKKLEDSRKKGQVAKSVEVNSFAILTFGMLIIYLCHKTIGANIAQLATKIFSSLDVLKLDKDSVQRYMQEGIFFYFSTLWPVFGGIILIGLVATIAQVGFKFSSQALVPNFGKFNPVKGLKNLFFTSRSFVEVAKSITKLSIIATFTYFIIKQFMHSSTMLVEFSISEIVGFMIDATYSLVWKVAMMFGLMAFADFGFQKYKFKNDMMMTKQEVKEENRQSEGNPQIKAKIRSMQIAAARKRMMQDVPQSGCCYYKPNASCYCVKI